MAQMDDGNVQPIRTIDDEAALAWLRAQPGGRTKLSDAELGRRWGWKRQRVGRRVKAWAKEGRITRRGNTITYADLGAVVPSPVPPPVPSAVPPLVPSIVPARAVKDEQPAALPPPAPDIGARAPAQRTAEQPPKRQPRYASIPLAVIAYGFFVLGIGINVWNAWNAGPIANVILPASMGVLAEAVMFFLPERTLSLPWAGKLLAGVILAFVAAFALTNSLRMASIISADQTMARADRQTAGTESAESKLDKAKVARDQACGKGLGKTVACQSRQSEVTKLEGKQTQATVKVAAQAKPEAGDFAKLVKWVSFGRLEPKLDDFEMLWLLFRTLLPQIGGLVLMLARR
jgi:hypothetical protein